MDCTVKASMGSAVTKEEAWAVMTDIEHCKEFIDGVEEVEVLDKGDPATKLGFEWRETRTMFNQKAVETMKITEAVPNEYYKTFAASHGCEYYTKCFIEEDGAGVTVGFDMTGKALTLSAKIVCLLMGWMFKGETKKALLKDLDDLKAEIHRRRSVSSASPSSS